MAISRSAPRKKSVARFSGKIFISYRRGDSASTTGRIYDWLASRHSKKDIFFDIESVEYGTDFEQRIQQSIPQSKVVLAVIGPHWLDDGVGPSKYVRAELELALSKGIPIIPVLVDGTTMPAPQQLPASLQAMSTLNAAEVRPGKDFQHDMELLAKPLGIPLVPRAQRILRSPGFWMLTGSAVALLALAIVGLLGGFPGTLADPRVSATATAAVRSATEAADQANAAASQTAVESTAIASRTAVAVTATANALAPYTYRTDEPAPGCDPKGTWTPAFNQSLGGGFSCLASSRGVQVTGPGSLNFSGADGFTFPVRSAISIDIQLVHPVCGAFVEVGLGGNGVIGSSYKFDMCDFGNGWTVSAANRYGVPYTKNVGVPDANVYHVTIVVIADASIQFSVNSHVLDTIDTSTNNAGLVFGPAISSFSIGIEKSWTGEEGGQGKAVFSKFEVVPQQ